MSRRLRKKVKKNLQRVATATLAAFLSFGSVDVTPFVYAEDTLSGDANTEATPDSTATPEATEVADDGNLDADNNIAPASLEDGDEGTYMPTDKTELHYITTEVFRGAKANGTYKATDDKDYTWVAENETAQHTFAYRINYETSGEGEIEAGQFYIIAPMHVIRDENGNWADEYEMSIPTEEEFEEAHELDPETILTYKEYDSDNDGVNDSFYIYNALHTTVAMNGYIEIGYSTTLKTFYYLDQTELAEYRATMYERDQSLVSNKCTVDIDTTATISSVAFDNNMPTRYNSWQSSWGDTIKPENDSDYYYILWHINTNITKDISQNYTLTYTNTLTGSGGEVEVVGYNFNNGQGWTANNYVTGQTQDQRVYASMITKHKKSDYQDLLAYTVKNDIVATVHPEDGFDADTSAKASKTYTWKKPYFTAPTGRFMIFQHGNGTWEENEYTASYWRDYYNNKHYSAWDGTTGRDYERYDLDKLQKGKVDSLELTYYSHGEGYSYPWTATNLNDPTTYGTNPVTFMLESNGFYLDQFESEEDLDDDYEFKTEPISSADYEITKIKYLVHSNAATFDEENQNFSLSYTKDGFIKFYAKFGDSADYVEIGTYNYATGEAVITDTDHVESITTDTVTFKSGANATEWKVETSNTDYYTEIEVRTWMNLKNSESVMNQIAGKELFYVSMSDHMTASDYKGNSLYDDKQWDLDRLLITQRNSNINKKVVGSSNNAKKKQYTITWSVEMNELITSGTGVKTNVKQNGGTFYDLIPAGSDFDVDSVYVTADGVALGESEYSVEVKENYKLSGRMLLIVKITTPANNYKVFYDTIHSWESISDYGYSRLNPVAYQTGNEDIAEGYYDDPTKPEDSEQGSALSSTVDRIWFANLDDSDDGSTARFIYNDAEKDILAITAASAGLTKKVKAGIESPDSSFSYKSITSINNTYSYRLRYANTYTNEASNLILFDSLENFTKTNKDGSVIESEWRGTLDSIDVSQLELKGIAPVVYISTVEKLNLDDHHDLTDTSIWQVVDENTDLSTAHAVAIDMRKKTDGSDFYLEAGGSVAAYLYMKAPSSSPEAHGSYPIAYNNIYISDTLHGINATEDYFIHQDYVQLKLAVTGNIKIHKVNADNEAEGIQGIKFRLLGTSDYGTDVDRILETDANGDLQFKGVEMGDYTLTEYDSTDDWQMDYTIHNVIIDANGNAVIDGTTYGENDNLTLTNKVRVHADISFKKRDLVSHKAIKDEMFKLSGTSDYGNEVLKTATSSSNGTVTFKNIEQGTYTLTQVYAVDGYFVNKGKFTVKIDEAGLATISNVSALEDSFESDSKGNFIIYNEPAHEFSLVKQNSYDYTAVKGVTFNLSGTSDNGRAVDATLTTDENGLVTFDGLEAGTYVLKETAVETIDGQINVQLDETPRVVSIDRKGNVEISGLEPDGEGSTTFIVVDTAIPEDTVTVIKKWNDGDKTVDHSKDMPTIHISAYKPEKALEITARVSGTDADGDGAYEVGETFKYAIQVKNTGNTTLYNVGYICAFLGKDTTEHGITLKAGESYDYATIYTLVPQDVVAGEATATFYAQGKDALGNTVKSKPSEVTVQCEEPSGPVTPGGGDTPSPIASTSSSTTTLSSVFSDAVSGLGNAVGKLFNVTTVNAAEVVASGTCTAGGTWSLDSDGALTLSGAIGWTGTNYNSVPWYNNRTSIESVVFNNAYGSGSLAGMFYGCSSLTSLDVSNFDTSKVTNMSAMFYGCSKLTSLDVSNFDTSKVTSMGSMFYGCSSLTNLDVSNFDTGNVQYMDSMFYKCSSLTNLDVSNFDTSKVTNMYYMFSGCSKLQDIYMSSKFKFLSGVSVPTHGATDTFTGKWTYKNAYNHTDAVSTLNSSTYDGTKPGLWTWEKNGEDPSLQNYTSKSENIYTPEYNDDGSVKQTPTEQYTSDGYWQKIDDTTYSYTFYVYDASIPWYVWEDAVDGYTSSGLSIAGKSAAATQNDPVYIDNGSDTVTITNISNEVPTTFGSLSITKTVSGTVPSGELSFSFAITLAHADGTAIEGTSVYDGVAFKNGSATVTVKAGETKTIGNIPAGYLYSVTELDSDYMTIPTYTNEKGTIPENDTAAVLVNNEFNYKLDFATGSFTVAKKLAGNDADSMADTEFSFVASIEGLGEGLTYHLTDGMEYSADKDGTATVRFKLKNGESLTFVGLPENAKYTVMEEASENCIASYEISSNTSVAKSKDANETATTELSTAMETVEGKEDATITFTNTTSIKRDIVLTKKVAGEGAETDKEFEFNIKLAGLTPNQIINSDVAGRFKADQDGEAEKTVNLKAGESITLYEVPTTIGYEITETKAANYVASATVNKVTAELTTNNDDSVTLSGTVTKTDEEPIAIDWTNTYEKQWSIVVKKLVAGSTGDKEADFDFSVQFDTKRANTELVVTDGNGKESLIKIDSKAQATFSLGHNEEIHFDGLTPDDMTAMSGTDGSEATEDEFLENLKKKHMSVNEDDYSKLGYETTYKTELNNDDYEVTVTVTNTNNTTIPTAIKHIHIAMQGFAVATALLGIVLFLKKKYGEKKA